MCWIEWAQDTVQ